MYYADVEKIDDNIINVMIIKDIKELPLWTNYNTNIFVQNEEAKLLSFSNVSKCRIFNHGYKLNNELWSKYIIKIKV